MARRILPLVLVLSVAAGAWYAWGPHFWWPTGSDAEQPPPPPLSYATKPEVGSLAPDFLLKTVDGKSVLLSDSLGKAVVVSFWTTRCPFCLTQLRNFERLANEDHGRVTVLAVNRQEIEPTVDDYVKAYLSTDGITVLLDENGDVYRRYRGEALPETFFIDAGGVVRGHARGELLLDEVRTRIKPLLQT